MKRFCSYFDDYAIVSHVSAVTPAEGTAYCISAQKEIDADEVKEGGTVIYVLQPVKVNGHVGSVIKSSTGSTAQVVKRKTTCYFRYSVRNTGKIISKFLHPIMKSSDFAGSIIDKGDSKYWAHVGWFFLLPLLFVKGNDGKIPVNTSHTLYTMENIEL